MKKYNYVVFTDENFHSCRFCETIEEAMKWYDLVTIAYNLNANDTNLTLAEMEIFTAGQFELRLVNSYEWAVHCYTFDEFVEFQNNIFMDYVQGQNFYPSFLSNLPIDILAGRPQLCQAGILSRWQITQIFAANFVYFDD